MGQLTTRFNRETVCLGYRATLSLGTAARDFVCASLDVAPLLRDACRLAGESRDDLDFITISNTAGAAAPGCDAGLGSGSNYGVSIATLAKSALRAVVPTIPKDRELVPVRRTQSGASESQAVPGLLAVRCDLPVNGSDKAA